MTKVTHLTLDEEGGLARKRIHLREISGDADAPLETVGQDLRAARLRRGDDLATVSRALKIRKDHLEALEEDRFEALPGRAYAVGFVRSYADYLGLDPLQCVERFKGEIAGREETHPTVGPPPDTEALRLPQGWLVIGVVVLGLIIYGAIHLARSADSLLRQPVAAVPERIAPPPPPTLPPPAPIHPAAAVPAVAPAPSGTAAQAGQAGAGSTGASGTALPGASATPVTPPVPGSTTTASLPPPAAGTPAQPGGAPATSPATGTPATTPSGATPQLIAASLPHGQNYGAQNKNARVVLRAYAPVRVLVQAADGTVYQNRMLRPGDSFNVPNKVGLTLTTPNGSAVGIELDGQSMGFAAKTAQMTEALSLDPQAIVDRASKGQ